MLSNEESLRSLYSSSVKMWIKVKNISPDKTTPTAATMLISLVLARLAVASCFSSFSLSEAFKQWLWGFITTQRKLTVKQILRQIEKRSPVEVGNMDEQDWNQNICEVIKMFCAKCISSGSRAKWHNLCSDWSNFWVKLVIEANEKQKFYVETFK